MAAISPFAGHARFGLLLLTAVAGLASSSARAVTLPPQPLAEVQLVKAPHEGLHFQWQAQVAERGGLFILARRGERRAQVSQLAFPERRTYAVSWQAPAASGAYELRYRTADGSVSVLATLLVNCQTLDDAPASQVTASQARDLLVAPSLPRFVGCAPRSLRWTEPDAQRRLARRAPPVPPPREGTRVA